MKSSFVALVPTTTIETSVVIKKSQQLRRGLLYKTKAAKWISKINYLATEKTPIKLKMK